MRKLGFKMLLYSLLVVFLSCSKEKRSDEAALKMQKFVVDISNYTRGIKPDFIIIPQNGIELAFNNCDTNEGLNSSYINAIDGIGLESLFYEEDLVSEDERLEMARTIERSGKKVMVSDFINNSNLINDAVQRCKSRGFVSFPRISSNYDYMQIPDTVIDENSNDIITLQDAKNYLYLINTDSFLDKEKMISSIEATNFDVILIDLFFNEAELLPLDVERLKTKANGAKRLVISYINIGAAENWRYYWKSRWNTVHPCWMRKKYEGYEDERWVKFWDDDWKSIIYGNSDSYMKKIIDAGFNGAYLDNVEAFYFLYYND